MADFIEFCASITTQCGVLKVTDTTGAYNATTNPTGWQGGSQPNGSDVTEATIMYYSGQYDPDARGTTVDVTDAIPDTVVGNFVLSDSIELSDYSDGYMTIVYTVTTATDTYTRHQTFLFTCNARCCIDQMFADIASDCDCECTQDEKIDFALKAEGMLRAVKSAASCASTTAVESMLAKIERLCEFNDCGCDD